MSARPPKHIYYADFDGGHDGGIEKYVAPLYHPLIRKKRSKIKIFRVKLDKSGPISSCFSMKKLVLGGPPSVRTQEITFTIDNKPESITWKSG